MEIVANFPKKKMPIDRCIDEFDWIHESLITLDKKWTPVGSFCLAPFSRFKTKRTELCCLNLSHELASDPYECGWLDKWVPISASTDEVVRWNSKIWM